MRRSWPARRNAQGMKCDAEMNATYYKVEFVNPKSYQEIGEKSPCFQFTGWGGSHVPISPPTSIHINTYAAHR